MLDVVSPGGDKLPTPTGPLDRAALLRWLADPLLPVEIEAVLRRFERGEDPLPGDEGQVRRVLRARALLAATAPSPDPLAEPLASMDARWQPLASVAWILSDEDWLDCFRGLPLPLPHTWWGARGNPTAPSEAAVLRALLALRGQAPQR